MTNTVLSRFPTTLCRREALGRFGAGLGAAAGLVAAPGLLVLSAAEAAASDFTLAPNYARNWVAHSAHPDARVVAIPGGVRLETGASTSANDQGVALWSKGTLGPRWTASFLFRLLDNVTASSQLIFALFYFGVTGRGTNGQPADISRWPANTVPYTHNYAAHINGARLAFARTQADDRAVASQVTAAIFNGGITDTTSIITPRAATFAFPPGVTCAVRISRDGDRVTFASRPLGGRNAAQTFIASGFTTAASKGHFGFLAAPSREFDLTALTITPR